VAPPEGSVSLGGSAKKWRLQKLFTAKQVRKNCEGQTHFRKNKGVQVTLRAPPPWCVLAPLSPGPRRPARRWWPFPTHSLPLRFIVFPREGCRPWVRGDVEVAMEQAAVPTSVLRAARRSATRMSTDSSAAVPPGALGGRSTSVMRAGLRRWGGGDVGGSFGWPRSFAFDQPPPPRSQVRRAAALRSALRILALRRCAARPPTPQTRGRSLSPCPRPSALQCAASALPRRPRGTPH